MASWRSARRSGLPWTALLWVIGIVVPAATATRVGVDAARSPVQAGAVALEALDQALAQGSDAQQVQQHMLTLRRNLARRPLDSRTRAIYASLLLRLSRRFDDAEAAVHHASRAAELAPVTVPVVKRAVLVLAHGGDMDSALEWVRRMFEYDPVAAAKLLLELEPIVYADQLPLALGDRPEAWLAWARQLRLEQRHDHALNWVAATHERWPDHLNARRLLAAQAARRGDWTTLEDLVLPLPDGPSAERAALLAYRALMHSQRGDTTAAQRDIDEALSLAPNSSGVHNLIGETQATLGNVELARRHWNTALFQLAADDIEARSPLLSRLARLEERHGQAATALRHWRALLALQPDHAEAQRRVRDLTKPGR